MLTFIFTAAGLAGVYLLAGTTGQAELFFGIALRVAIILYVFGFVDAYFTATEMSDGTYSLITEHPRVAAVLNLISLWFGYFYVRQKKRGMIMMAVGYAINQAARGADAGIVFVAPLPDLRRSSERWRYPRRHPPPPP